MASCIGLCWYATPPANRVFHFRKSSDFALSTEAKLVSVTSPLKLTAGVPWGGTARLVAPVTERSALVIRTLTRSAK